MKRLGYRKAAEEAVDAVLLASASQPQIKYQLAYEAAAARLAQQDGTLGNLRNRSTSVFSIATVVAALVSTAGLVTKTLIYPIGIAVGLLAAVSLIGLCTLVVVWPVRVWNFGPDSAGLLEYSGGADQARKAATIGMNKACVKNEAALRFRMLWYQASIIGLGLETALVAASVIAYR